MAIAKSWHSLTLPQIFKTLKTDKSGLSEEEVKKRLKKFGYNRLPKEKGLTALQILFDQIKSPLVYILILAVVVSLFLREFVDAGVILAIVIINTLIGFFQENKANQAITKLKAVIHYQAKVLRGGKPLVVDTEKVVIGDIVILEAGMKVPADCRLLEAINFQTEEAALTGESHPSNKKIKVLPKGTIVSDRENIVYLGTTVTRGKGLAIVCATGKQTQLGQIATLVKETEEEKTPLQNKIGKLARFLAIGVAVITVLLFLLGIVRGESIGEMFLVSVAVAVAAVPEGLVVALTVILVIGMQKILKKKSLVRRLVAAETLGSTTVICSDKTGTLTEGKMRVVSVLTNSEDFKLGGRKDKEISPDVSLALEIGMLCNNSFIINPEEQLAHAKFVGEPTEQALLVAGIAVDFNQEQLQKDFPRLKEVPFSSEQMYMATLNQGFKGQTSVLVKGAPEIILSKAKFLSSGGKITRLSTAKKEELLKKFEKLTAKGLRLLAAAYKKVPQKINNDLDKEVKDLIFVGVFALKDPLRSDAKETIDLCRQAGIKPIIITGDHQLTALTIAQEVGMKVHWENVLTGVELDQLDDKAFAKRAKKINVYARVEPRHKIRIVDELQRQGEVVAMAGDGVNDAPAIKSADIGLALGSGTDVAKETADIVLLDDSFHTIVDAVRGGRVIFDNIRKVILYLLFSSFSEVILIGGAIIAGLPLPLLATQILWVNIVQDSLPVFALAADPEERDIMKEKPRGRKISIFDAEMKTLIFFSGILTDIILLIVVYYFYRRGLDLAYIRTFTFMAVAMVALFYIFACRSLRWPIWKYNPLANKYINGAVLIGIALMLIAVYLPIFQKLLHTVPLGIHEWLILLGIGLFNLLAIEVTKEIFILRKKRI